MRWALVLLVLSACQAPIEHRRITGAFTYGFEFNHFRETGQADANWCLSQESVEILGLGRPNRWMVRVDIVADAEISAPGQYGHMGMCTREVRITRIIQKSEPYCALSAEACLQIEEIERREALEQRD
jgi:hypothetical protein